MKIDDRYIVYRKCEIFEIPEPFRNDGLSTILGILVILPICFASNHGSHVSTWTGDPRHSRCYSLGSTVRCIQSGTCRQIATFVGIFRWHLFSSKVAETSRVFFLAWHRSGTFFLKNKKSFRKLRETSFFTSDLFGYNMCQTPELQRKNRSSSSQ